MEALSLYSKPLRVYLKRYAVGFDYVDKSFMVLHKDFVSRGACFLRVSKFEVRWLLQDLLAEGLVVRVNKRLLKVYQ